MKRAAQLFYNIIGLIALGLGLAGIIVPLLPTTPFLLLASACFLRGSERLHNWLMQHPRLGPYIRSFRDERAMTLRAKIWTFVFLWASLLFSMYQLQSIGFTVLLAAIGVIITTLLLRMNTLSPERSAATVPDR